jgi:8-oxo-dGTP diphosphatase
MHIEVKSKLLTVEHPYPDFHLTMHTYLCETEQSEPKLTEHLAYQWLEKSELMKLDWAGADVPVVNKIFLLVKMAGKSDGKITIMVANCK